MNSFVNVQVRIIAAQAQAQLAAMQARLTGLEKGFRRGATAGTAFGGALGGAGLAAFGSKVQWAGRQLEYNFTLPILAAGGAAMKMALDNQAAMTRITKVYGDATHDASFYRMEIEALGRSFEVLSNRYGINQAEVLNVAASWAAAGASGLALAKSVDLTMQTMVLGEMDAAEATQALISIQAQYGFGVEDLTKTIATLNMVENQTGISLKGLVQGFERSAGIARSTGVDVRHLAAMLAALTPATGSAAQAGNALKTIFSRLISPTKETTEVLGLMGINIADMSWKSATMTDRLIVMAKKFEGLSDSQKGVVSSVAASRWQVNKFEVLMREMINTNGYYQKALQATSNETAVFNQANKELQAVLNSNPRRLQIIWTMLQNAATDIIQPMIPMILWLASSIQKMVTAFSKLPAPLQTAIMSMLLMLAVLGPLIRIGGAVVLMLAELGGLFKLLLAPVGMVVSALGFLLKLPISLFLSAFGMAIRGAIATLSLLGPAAAWAMRQLSVAVLTGSAIMGRAMASGFGVMQSVAIGGWAAIGVIFRRMIFVMQGILMAGARGLGIAWRAALAAIAAVQAAFTAVMAMSWGAMFSRVGSIVAAGFNGIIALFTRAIPMIRAASMAVMSAMTGPWGIAITAVIVLVIAFWDDLKSLWHAVVNGTVNAFNSLPQGIYGAMQAVVNIVKAAAMAVYKLFSYLNPWAHHSPSLVENVTTGMAEVVKQFNVAKGIGNVFKGAYSDMQKFGKYLADIKAQSDASEYMDIRKNVKAIEPAALASFDRLVAALPKMQKYLNSLKPALDGQTAVVAAWKVKLDAANAALDKQSAKLSKLQKIADAYQEQLSAAQGALDSYANAPIKGMREMDDAIFAASMQQKKLQYQLMQMEQAVGPMDKLQSKLDAISGQMEMLKGTQTELRNSGAGSEILSQYDEQINALKDQQKAINAQLAPMQNLSNQIDELGNKAEMLDLEKSLKFDELTRQIDQAANSMKELPFEEIMAGVVKNKAEVDRLTEAYNKAKAAVDKQQGIVDMYTQQRDALQARYDAENSALEKLQTQYDKYESQIRDVEQALRDAGSAADTLAQAKKKAGGKDGAGGGGGMSPGAENFKAGAGGNFGDPGGFAQIGREGGIGDQASMIDDFTKEMADKTKNLFGGLNFIEPLKAKWNQAWGWVKSNIGPIFTGIGSSISGWWTNFNPFGEGASASWVSTIKDVANSIWDAMKMVWDAIGPDVIDVGKKAWEGLKGAFAALAPEIQQFRDFVGPLGEALGNLWKILKPIIGVVLALAGAILKGLLQGVAQGLKPFIKMFGEVLGGLVRILRGVIEFLIGVFTLDWKMAWKGISDIVSGIWKAIWGIIKGGVQTIWGIIKGFVEGFFGFFVWLWDELVGHSIVPDIVNDIVAWIAKLPGMVWGALSTLGTKMITRAKDALTGAKNAIVNGWNAALTLIKGWAAAVWNALSTFGSKFIDRAKNALTSMKTAVTNGWTTVRNTITGWAGSAYNALSGLAGKVKDRASETMTGFLNKITDKWGAIKSWFNGLGGKIKDAVGSLSDLLSNIGSAIMNSLWNGLKSKWDDVKGWLGGVGDKIKSIKGPIEKDRILLVDEGAAIMDSLGVGLKKQWPDVQDMMSGVASDMKSAMSMQSMLDRMTSTQNTNTLAGQQAGYSSAGGTTVNNFYGDLSFPSIDNESDAEEFLKNLEAITRS